MSYSSLTVPLNVEVQHGKPPMLRADAIEDAPRWASEHRDALRAAVVQHGSLLVRGLGLRDVAGTEDVFRRLGSPMTEKEAFASRRRYSQGVYSASKWPPNQCSSRWPMRYASATARRRSIRPLADDDGDVSYPDTTGPFSTGIRQSS